MLRQGLISVVLRSLTLASKFVLLLYLVRYFSAETVGEYGLIVVTISIALYFLGADFYVFSTREVITQPRHRLPALLRNQLALHAVTYAIVLPLLIGLFAMHVIGWKYALWFYGILVLEHLSQEAYRLLVAISQPARANVVLFVRGGAWVYVAVALGMFSGELQNLTTIWIGWLTGSLLSILLAASSLKSYAWRDALNERIDWHWIRRGLGVSLPYLVASLSLIAVQFSDRYVISAFRDEAQLGIYTFYAQIANTVQLLVTTGVTSVIYPKMITACQQSDVTVFKQLFRKMSWAVIGGTLAISLLIMVMMPLLLQLLNRPHLTEYGSLLWLLLLGNALLTLSHIPHYSLYAQGRDRAIVYSTTIASILTIGLNCLLVPDHGLYGAALGTSIGAGLLLASKAFMNYLTLRQFNITSGSMPTSNTALIHQEELSRV